MQKTEKNREKQRKNRAIHTEKNTERERERARRTQRLLWRKAREASRSFWLLSKRLSKSSPSPELVRLLFLSFSLHLDFDVLIL
jgi:hypothetical protein